MPEKKIIDIYNSICLPKIYFENNIFKKEFIDTGDKNKFNFLDYRKLLIEDQKGYLEDNILKTYYTFSLINIFEEFIKNMELPIKITLNDPFES